MNSLASDPSDLCTTMAGNTAQTKDNCQKMRVPYILRPATPSTSSEPLSDEPRAMEHEDGVPADTPALHHQGPQASLWMIDEGGRPPLGLGEQSYETFPSLGELAGEKPVPVPSYHGVSGGSHSSQKSGENGEKRSFSTNPVSKLLRQYPTPALNPLQSLAHPSDSSAKHPEGLPVSWCTTDGLLRKPLALRSNESGVTVTLRKWSRYGIDRQWDREDTDQVTQKIKAYHNTAIGRKKVTESFVNTVSRAVEKLLPLATVPQMSSATERLCQEAVNLGFDFTSRNSLVSWISSEPDEPLAS